MLCCAVLCCAVLCCATVVNTACTDARLGTGPARLPSALARLGYPRHWAGSATLGTGPARLPSGSHTVANTEATYRSCGAKDAGTAKATDKPCGC